MTIGAGQKIHNGWVEIWSSHSPNEDMVAHVARFEHGYPVK